MKLLNPLLLGAVLFGSATPAFAGTTAELSITGKIITSACSLDFANEGVINFGNISAATIDEYGIQLNGSGIEFSVACASPTKFAFSFKDNRPQFPYNVFFCEDSTDRSPCNYGLGHVNDVAIGTYSIHLESNSANYTYGIRSPDQGSTWKPVTSSSYSISTKQWYTFTDSSFPTGISTFAGVLSSSAAIKPRADLPPLDNVIPLDGSATIELIYL